MPSSANKKQPAAAAAPAAAASSSASRKRKLGVDKSMPKFYAVRAGHKPGVYLTWPDCQEQTAGFRGASYKSFLSLQDAQDFVAGKNPVGASDGKGDKFYAVAVGTTPGIYTTWEVASEAIKGAKGPKYKKFNNRTDAEAFIRSYAKGMVKGAVGEEDEDEEEDDDEPAAKKARTSKKADPAILDIYTDGSSLSNGRAGATAGVGVYFGKGDKRNVSERLQGEPQTNQRAELTAILRALQKAGTGQSVQIITDSKYSINCVTEWYRGWIKKGWKTSQGEDVLNQDLIKAIRKLIDGRDVVKSKTLFQWVKGHGTNVGNVNADQLAVQGAKIR